MHHRPVLETELKKTGFPYSIRYIEDDVECQQKYNIKGSPNVLVDGELVFRGMPDVPDLKTYLGKNLILNLCAGQMRHAPWFLHFWNKGAVCQNHYLNEELFFLPFNRYQFLPA